jgi:hypothetical protein
MRSTHSLIAVGIVLWTASCMTGQARREPYSPRLISYDPARLTTYSTTELIDLLSGASIEKNASGQGIYSVLPPDRRQVDSPSETHPNEFVEMKIDPHATDYTLSVEQEIAKRRPYKELAYVFAQTTDEVQQAWMADVLAEMRGPEADAVLRPYVSKAKDETAYLALKYFAGACDTEALGILNRNYFKYSTSSLEWASIVRSFGVCKYTPAVPNLVGSVTAMVINLGYASHLSLLAIYPDAKIEFGDPFETQNAWRKYLRDHR